MKKINIHRTTRSENQKFKTWIKVPNQVKKLKECLIKKQISNKI